MVRLMLMTNRPIKELFFIVESARKNDQLVNGRSVPFKTAYRYYNLLTGNRIDSFIKSCVNSLTALGFITHEEKALTIFPKEYEQLKKDFPAEIEIVLGKIGNGGKS